MSSPAPITSFGLHRRGPHRSTWSLTVAVVAITLIVSVAAMASPRLMGLFVRDLPKARSGQWWRFVTPVFVQPDGWGQLAFNLLGIAVVGAALERRTSRTVWTLTFLLGGVGSIAIISAWHPPDPGGGSSDAVAALIGAFTVLLAFDDQYRRHQHPDRVHDQSVADTFSQLYCVFFVSYLAALDLGGVWWSIIIGNTAIIALVNARRVIRSALPRACLVVVAAGGAIMTVKQDGHGIGIIAGIAVGTLIAWHGTTPTDAHLRVLRSGRDRRTI